MTLTLIRSAAGAGLLAVLAAGCDTAVTAHHAAPSRPPRPSPASQLGACPGNHADGPARDHRARPGATAPASPAKPIPQGNGGDQDPDNNGGPSDGDGNI